MNENGYLTSAGGNGAILHLAVVFLGLVRKPLELSVTRSGRHCMLEKKKEMSPLLMLASKEGLKGGAESTLTFRGSLKYCYKYFKFSSSMLRNLY